MILRDKEKWIHMLCISSILSDSSVFAEKREFLALLDNLHKVVAVETRLTLVQIGLQILVGI